MAACTLFKDSGPLSIQHSKSVVNMAITNLLDWGIEINGDGGLKYFVYNTNLKQYYMCKDNFLVCLGLSDADIDLMIAVGHWRIRPAPEE